MHEQQQEAVALDIRDGSHELGRLVALAVPAHELNRLPELSQKFHTTEATAAMADTVLRQLLAQQVGVFGFTVKDPHSQPHVWF